MSRPGALPRWAFPAILAAAGAAVYVGSLPHPFVYDDLPAIVENPSIRSLLPLNGALWAPGESATAWRPLANLTLAVNYALGGLDPAGYRAANVAIHLAAALLLFALLRRTFRSAPLAGRFGARAEPLAFAAALLWCLHPLQTESVTYVSTRTESLMGMCFLAGLWTLSRASEAVRPGRWQAACVAACLGAIGSKDIGLLFPFLALLYDRAFLAGSFAGALRARGAMYAALAGTWIFGGWLSWGRYQAGRAHFEPQGEDATRLDYAITQLGVVAHYLRLSFWPHPLRIEYSGWPMAKGLASVWGSAAIVFGLLFATARGLRRNAPWGFAGAWLFGILAPTSSFLPILRELGAERRMYLPLAAVAAIAVALADRLAARLSARSGVPEGLPQRAGAGLLALAALALGGATVARNADYASAATLWASCVEADPGSAASRNNWGAELARSGRLPEALAQFREAVRLRPRYAQALDNLGFTLLRMGRPREAEEPLARAVALKPQAVSFRVHRGEALLECGRRKEALSELEEALRLGPSGAEARFWVGLVHARGGDFPAAVAHFSEAVRAQPGFLRARHHLAVALAASGQPADAERQYRQILQIDPGHVPARFNLAKLLARSGRAAEGLAEYRAILRSRPDFAPAANDAAWILATHPDAAFRDGAEAVRLAEAAVRSGGGGNPVHLDTLAAAYAEAGRFDEAAGTARKALERTAEEGKAELAFGVQERLRLYESGKPFRQEAGAKREDRIDE